MNEIERLTTKRHLECIYIMLGSIETNLEK